MTRAFTLLLAGGCLSLLSACTPAEPPDELTIYSGRDQSLVQPVVEGFQRKTGIAVRVQYGGSAQLAATILDEGAASAADVYFGQDAGALGMLAREGRLRELPDSILEPLDARFRATDRRWVGTSGRARVLAYNTNAVSEDELPDRVTDLADPRWRGRIGWAPENASFQAFVTAMRVLDGEDATREWLTRMVANDPKVYRDNTPLFEAVASGEIDVGLTNHYYRYRFLHQSDDVLPVANYVPRGGGAGALVNIAGAGVVDSSIHEEAALRFIEHLLSPESQAYFASEVFEYPLAGNVATVSLEPPLADIRTPELDLGQLGDLETTLALLQAVGAL